MINFKKHPIITYATLSISFIIITTSTLAYFIKTMNNYQANNTPQIIEQQPNHKYLVKEIDGKINIFEGNNTSPSIILNKQTIFLPEYDRKMLSKGIYLNDINELHSLMEDYDD